MSGVDPARPDQGSVLLGLYDRALPQVYGYLRSRCGTTATAEDLTGETFLAAVSAVNHRVVDAVTVAWLIGIARHKLVDHWRRTEREQRTLRLAHENHDIDDPWDVTLDVAVARDLLHELGPHHRAVLTLRYLDGLSVPEVAEVVGRTVHATEALLVRAKRAFRVLYEEGRADA